MADELETLIGLLTDAGFVLALIASLTLLGVFYLATAARRPRLGGWAVSLTAAGLIVLIVLSDLSSPDVPSLVLIAVGGGLLDFLAALIRRKTTLPLASLAWVPLVLAVLWFTTTVDFPDDRWIELSLPVVVLATGAAIRAWDRLPIAHLAGPLFAITAFGIWATVPDTDRARVLLGASIPMALATLPPISARITGAGAFPLAALAAWVVAEGGVTRPGSVLGGWACIGLLALIPLVGVYRGSRFDYVVLVSHAVVVLLASRVIGFQESAVTASIGVVVLGIVTVLALRMTADRDRSHTPVTQDSEARPS